MNYFDMKFVSGAKYGCNRGWEWSGWNSDGFEVWASWGPRSPVEKSLWRASRQFFKIPSWVDCYFMHQYEQLKALLLYWGHPNFSRWSAYGRIDRTCFQNRISFQSYTAKVEYSSRWRDSNFPCWIWTGCPALYLRLWNKIFFFFLIYRKILGSKTNGLMRNYLHLPGSIYFTLVWFEILIPETEFQAKIIRLPNLVLNLVIVNATL